MRVRFCSSVRPASNGQSKQSEIFWPSTRMTTLARQWRDFRTADAGAKGRGGEQSSEVETVRPGDRAEDGHEREHGENSMHPQ